MNRRKFLFFFQLFVIISFSFSSSPLLYLLISNQPISGIEKNDYQNMFFDSFRTTTNLDATYVYFSEENEEKYLEVDENEIENQLTKFLDELKKIDDKKLKENIFNIRQYLSEQNYSNRKLYFPRATKIYFDKDTIRFCSLQSKILIGKLICKLRDTNFNENIKGELLYQITIDYLSKGGIKSKLSVELTDFMTHLVISPIGIKELPKNNVISSYLYGCFYNQYNTINNYCNSAEKNRRQNTKYYLKVYEEYFKHFNPAVIRKIEEDVFEEYELINNAEKNSEPFFSLSLFSLKHSFNNYCLILSTFSRTEKEKDNAEKLKGVYINGKKISKKELVRTLRDSLIDIIVYGKTDKKIEFVFKEGEELVSDAFRNYMYVFAFFPASIKIPYEKITNYSYILFNISKVKKDEEIHITLQLSNTNEFNELASSSGDPLLKYLFFEYVTPMFYNSTGLYMFLSREFQQWRNPSNELEERYFLFVDDYVNLFNDYAELYTLIFLKNKKYHELFKANSSQYVKEVFKRIVDKIYVRSVLLDLEYIYNIKEIARDKTKNLKNAIFFSTVAVSFLVFGLGGKLLISMSVPRLATAIIVGAVVGALEETSREIAYRVEVRETTHFLKSTLLNTYLLGERFVGREKLLEILKHSEIKRHPFVVRLAINAGIGATINATFYLFGKAASIALRKTKAVVSPRLSRLFEKMLQNSFLRESYIKVKNVYTTLNSIKIEPKAQLTKLVNSLKARFGERFVFYKTTRSGEITSVDLVIVNNADKLDDAINSISKELIVPTRGIVTISSHEQQIGSKEISEVISLKITSNGTVLIAEFDMTDYTKSDLTKVTMRNIDRLYNEFLELLPKETRKTLYTSKFQDLGFYAKAPHKHVALLNKVVVTTKDESGKQISLEIYGLADQILENLYESSEKNLVHAFNTRLTNVLKYKIPAPSYSDYLAYTDDVINFLDNVVNPREKGKATMYGLLLYNGNLAQYIDSEVVIFEQSRSGILVVRRPFATTEYWVGSLEERSKLFKLISDFFSGKKIDKSQVFKLRKIYENYKKGIIDKISVEIQSGMVSKEGYAQEVLKKPEFPRCNGCGFRARILKKQFKQAYNIGKKYFYKIKK